MFDSIIVIRLRRRTFGRFASIALVAAVAISLANAQQPNPLRSEATNAAFIEPVDNDPTAAADSDPVGSGLAPTPPGKVTDSGELAPSAISKPDRSKAPPPAGQKSNRAVAPPSALPEDSSTELTPTARDPIDTQALLPDDVRPSSFEGITPGSTSAMELVEKLGEPKSRARQQGTISFVYAIGPFPEIQFLVIDDVVESILVTLQQPVAIDAITKDLSLTAFEPAPVPDDSGRVLGIAFPERGVLFAFSPDADTDKITQIVLEPITSEPFVHRAEYDSRHRYTQNLTDLNFALKVDPRDAKAHWLRARILTQLNDHQAALADIERAVKIAPEEPKYRLTRALLIAETGRYDEAIRETRNAQQMKDASALLQARAECQLGDLLANGPAHDYKQAIEHHMAAIERATPLAKSNAAATRRAAQQILLDAHLAAAHDIAAGRWRRKSEVVATWRENAHVLADAIVKHEAADPYVQWIVDCQSLAIYDILGETNSVAEIAERTITRGRELLAAADDPLYQQCLEWELGEALVHAAQVEHRRGDQPAALKHANNAHALLESQLEQGRDTPRTRYLIGKLRFLIGANHAVFQKDHREAIVWYEKTLPVLSQPLPVAYSNQLGPHGERFVSMGVSFWMTDEREKGVQLTRQGLSLMQKAVETQGYERNTLTVPYNNLASMYQQMGDNDKAKSFNDALRGLKTAQLPSDKE